MTDGLMRKAGRVPLLAAKLYIPPPRTSLVSRPRLIQRLDEGMRLGHRLSLVSSSAGTGKTTLLSEWVAHIRDGTAWLSLDEEDNDPLRFWTYLMAALRTVNDELGQTALQYLQASQHPFSGAAPSMTDLINDIAALPGRVVLVLDDYHVISSQAMHDGIAFLLEHQPSQLHLVIATRADPPLPFIRMRARTVDRIAR